MTEDRLKELRKKYKSLNLLDELNYASHIDHNGYMTLPQSDYINWLCDGAYNRIVQLENRLRPRRAIVEDISEDVKRYKQDCDRSVKGDTRCEICNGFMFDNIGKIIDKQIRGLK